MKRSILALIMAFSMTISAGCKNTEQPAETTQTTETTTATETTVTESVVKKLDYEIDPDKPVIALTFDDGPNTSTTKMVLDKLEKYGVRASFFLIGDNISDESAKIVKRAYDMGCEINNHSQTHGYMNSMTAEEIKSEVDFVSDKVTEITGEPPKFFRPPYIAVNETMYENIDMPFIAGFGCNDWDAKVTADERAKKTLEQAADGSIILLHDAQGNLQTVTALDKIIPPLLEEGYQFVTVSELFEIKGVEISGSDTNLYSIVE